MPNWVQSLWIATWTRIRLPLSFVVVKIWPSISGPRKKEIKLVYILMMIIEKKNCCWKHICFKENMNSSKKSKFKSASKISHFWSFRQGRPKVALIYFDKACEELELDPPVPEPYLARSKCYIQLGEVCNTLE